MEVGKKVESIESLVGGKKQEEQGYDWMVSESDQSVLKNLSAMGEKLKELNKKMLAAQAAADMAKSEYEHFANNILPNAMTGVGVETITLASGGTLSVKRSYYCSPNKNEEDRKVIAEWLEQHGGGHLVKEAATIEGEENVALLEGSGIPYAKKVDVNTASLKAFIRDQLGVTSGTQQITMEDIPKCIHFQEVLSVELK